MLENKAPQRKPKFDMFKTNFMYNVYPTRRPDINTSLLGGIKEGTGEMTSYDVSR